MRIGVIHRYMICRAVCCLAVIMTSVCTVARTYRTAVFSDDVKTLQIIVNNDQLSQPIVSLGGDDELSIEFDELTYVNSNFYYKIVQCNADWSVSQLSSMEYLDGLDQNQIHDYEYSVNTTVNYIHYRLILSREDVKITRSGNYAVLIARDNDFDDGLVACACFSVVEPLAQLGVAVTGNTMLELNGRFQQLTITSVVGDVNPANIMTDFLLVINQNGRPDTERIISRPTYLRGKEMEYVNSKDLVFEGGNQYRSIDFSSRFTYGAGIDHIEFFADEYQVVLDPSMSRRGVESAYNQDAFGGFVVNLQGNEYDATEADYMRVHFTYPADVPLINEDIYLLGAMSYNTLDVCTRLMYDMDNKTYIGNLLLKQGGYNFVYATMNKYSSALSLYDTEGSLWSTRNLYNVYLYYRPMGARYDRLVGYTSFVSQR